MTDPRVKVKLPGGQWARGSLLDNQGDHGPSRILVDATYPARLVEPADWALVYRCVFDRIGRNHDVAPLTAEVRTAEQLADKVLYYARPHLASSDVDVWVNTVEMRGLIVVGAVRTGGSFVIEAVEPDTEMCVRKKASNA